MSVFVFFFKKKKNCVSDWPSTYHLLASGTIQTTTQVNRRATTQKQRSCGPILPQISQSPIYFKTLASHWDDAALSPPAIMPLNWLGGPTPHKTGQKSAVTNHFPQALIFFNLWCSSFPVYPHHHPSLGFAWAEKRLKLFSVVGRKRWG